jgi:hypothetical protein
MRRRVLGLALTALMLYGVAPAVVDVLGGWRDLDRVSPAWWVAVLATQVAGWGCLWMVQRLALNRARWSSVATSQLASGALGRVVPGGAAAAAAALGGTNVAPIKSANARASKVNFFMRTPSKVSGRLLPGPKSG